MSANGSGNGTGIWGIARLAGPALIALVLAGVALPWILDAGTAHLPAIGVGVSTESGSSGPPAVAKIVVTPSSKGTGTQHHPHSTAVPPASTQTRTSGSGSTSNAGEAAGIPVVQPVHPSSAGSSRTAAPPSPAIKTTPRSQKPAPETQPPANVNGHGNEDDQRDESPAATTHGRALGHEKHAFHGNAEDKGRPPRGLALGHRNHVPPGQARQNSESHGRGSGDEGQDSQGDDNGEQGHSSHGHHGDTPPGHADGSHGADSHGRGHGH